MHSIGLKLASKPTCEVLSSCLCSSTHCAHTVPEHFLCLNSVIGPGYTVVFAPALFHPNGTV